MTLVTLLAHEHMTGPVATVRRAAWYRKERPTFADALALIRCELWRHEGFQTSTCAEGIDELPRAFVERLTEALCYVT